MKVFVNRLTQKFSRRSGQGLVEYTLVIALVVIACITALTLLGNNTKTQVTNVATQVGAAP